MRARTACGRVLLVSMREAIRLLGGVRKYGIAALQLAGSGRRFAQDQFTTIAMGT